MLFFFFDILIFEINNDKIVIKVWYYVYIVIVYNYLWMLFIYVD